MLSSFARQVTPPTPEQAPYRPYGGARELWMCREKRVLLEGPSGTGKTRGALEKGYLFVNKYPKSRILLVRETRESMSESVLVTFEDKVLPDDCPLKQGPNRHNRQVYDLPNGSAIVIMGLDKPSKAMSTEYDMIIVFEAIECAEEDVESLTTRLRNGKAPYQQLILDYNPAAAPTHWINQWAESGKATRIYSRHEDNPTVTAEYLETLRSLTGARRAWYYEGKWAQQAGRVYDFDQRLHVWNDKRLAEIGIIIKDDHTVESGIAYCIGGMDWGFSNPGTLQVWGVDNDGRLILLREWYRTGQVIDWWLEQAIAADEAYNIRDWVPDPSEPAYIKALQNQFGRGKVYPANNAIMPGIQAVTARLAVAGDMRPRLILRADALVERDPVRLERKHPTGLRQEFDAYVWPKTQAGHADKETPVKEHDHALDTCRYVVMHQDGPRKSSAAGAF